MRRSLAVLCFTGVMYVACRPSDSDLNVVNGSETSGYAAVMRVQVDKARGRFCTGTAVSDTTLLLAAHCIKAETLADNLQLERANANAPVIMGDAVDMWYSVGDLDQLTEDQVGHDLAVVWFPPGTFKSWVQIAPAAPTSKSVSLVGFGADGFTQEAEAKAFGVKRVGNSRISMLYPDRIVIRAPLADKSVALLASGDAGGPMFDADGRLLGLGSAMILEDAQGQSTGIVMSARQYRTVNTQNATVAHNEFVNLTSPASQWLLRRAASEGAKIPGYGDGAKVTMGPEETRWMTVDGSIEHNGPLVAITGGIPDSLVAPGARLALQDGGDEGLNLQGFFSFFPFPFFSLFGSSPSNATGTTTGGSWLSSLFGFTIGNGDTSASDDGSSSNNIGSTGVSSTFTPPDANFVADGSAGDGNTDAETSSDPTTISSSNDGDSSNINVTATGSGNVTASATNNGGQMTGTATTPSGTVSTGGSSAQGGTVKDDGKTKEAAAAAALAAKNKDPKNGGTGSVPSEKNTGTAAAAAAKKTGSSVTPAAATQLPKPAKTPGTVTQAGNGGNVPVSTKPAAKTPGPVTHAGKGANVPVSTKPQPVAGPEKAPETYTRWLIIDPAPAQPALSFVVPQLGSQRPPRLQRHTRQSRIERQDLPPYILVPPLTPLSFSKAP